MFNTQNTLLLVVDIQQRLLPVLHDKDNWLSNNKKIITGLNALGVKAVMTEQYPKGLGSTLDSIRALLPETPVFEKTRFSAMIDDVAQYIITQNIENVIVIGCETHVCVLQTVLDLRDKNLNVYVPHECVTSRTLDNKNNALMQIQAAGAVVSNIESLLFHLMKDAQHPAFKTISQLVK
ncbi:isochorismatase family protein [Alysiella filiformis]|uniref:Nicotinamidase-related amidase n=1 Tax=Alysiella filiformis DSM 16848 TaxID=1120981 RepID=A0A286E8N7_9NEIS|nr:isochorismatase family protein [Alysiella filiformis]QMT32105.1 isochorismatase family protein [Alysiella filiformis]UBQ56985.1 isochorismatase family protein [Alysiella filiformis DSM 16848]SOD67266.1 Nicotinamidase-related amidase [Alysiella filiformis DSM 16848]